MHRPDARFGMISESNGTGTFLDFQGVLSANARSAEVGALTSLKCSWYKTQISHNMQTAMLHNN